MKQPNIDLKSIASGNRLYNLHSHTQFCDGRAPMEAFAQAAVEQGFKVYGFTPHSPLYIDSPCNMSLEDVPTYLAEVERIRNVYGDSCRFLAGMEIDYLGHHWGPASDYFQALPLDYSIGSVHFIPTQNGEYIDIDGSQDAFVSKMHQHFHDDIRYVVNTFYDQSQEMILAGGFNIIGHFDKIGHNANFYAPGIEDEDWYQRRVNQLIDTIIASGIAVEINTKAFAQHNRLFPSPRHLKRLVDAGVTILVNSDAHYPDRINASRAYAFSLLDALHS